MWWTCACNVDHSWCAKLWAVPLFPGCSGEEERWHWSWVRSTDLRCPHLTITTDQVTPPPVADLLHLDTVFTLPITSDVLETFPVYVLQSLVSIATQTCIDTATRWPTRVHIPAHLINLSLLIFAIISCAAPPIAPLPADRMAARSETTHW